MTEFSAGDIVSVEFPFSDLQIRKRRPGLVLFCEDADMLVARLTTHEPRVASDVALEFWAESGLPRASTVRLGKLATIDRRLVSHKIGRLHSADCKAVAQAWQLFASAFVAELRI